MAESDALKTISYYTVLWDRWFCVFYFCYVLKMVRPIWANVFNTGLATLTAAAIYLLHPSPLICNAGAFVIGFPLLEVFLQLGVSVVMRVFR